MFLSVNLLPDDTGCFVHLYFILLHTIMLPVVLFYIPPLPVRFSGFFDHADFHILKHDDIR